MITKINRLFRAGLVGCALCAAFVACTDTWNDHYEATADGVTAGSLWEAICQNDELSNFRRVLEATGYDRSLASSQVFTVFAPTNSAFSAEDANRIIALYEQQKQQKIKDKDNRAIKEFVQNHIALYNYSVSPTSNDSIVMMNGKYLVLKPETMANGRILTDNQLTGNGVLFTMADRLSYVYNVFEYLSADNDIDSVGNFLSTFNVYEFMPTLSVPGGIIDGQTWYLDSVSVLQNELFDELDDLTAEDSTYWMVVPTNNVWDRLVAEYTPYFNYDDNVRRRDSLQWVETRMAILRGSVFSATRNTNANGVWNPDSVLSVNAVGYALRQTRWGRSNMAYYQYAKPFAEGGVFNGTVNQQCSNGQVMKTGDWHINKLETFMREVLVEGENRSYLDGVDEVTTMAPTYVSVQTSNPYYNLVSGNRFVVVAPSGTAAAEVRFKLPNMLSNVGYDIYAVMLPATAADTLVDASQLVPCKFNASFSYHYQDGTQSEDYYLPENDPTLRASARHNFESDPTRADTIQLASNVTVPTCSYGLSDTQVMLRLRTSLRNAERQNGTRTATMRIDCIIVKPHQE